jgi:6-phosphogluconolactonase
LHYCYKTKTYTSINGCAVKNNMKKCLTIALFLMLAGWGYTQQYYLFIGTYTGTGSKGIYMYRFDAATGKATLLSNTDSGSVVNPSFLTVAPNGKHLYAVTETATPNAGSVSAFSFDKNSGKLSFINKQESGGDNPCYVAITSNQEWVTVGNYSGGSLSAYRLDSDGSLQPYSQNIQHNGKGPNADRQEKAHVHCTLFTPDEQYLLVPDLGMDKVMMYAFHPDADKPLTPATQPFAQSNPGHGPRHITFSPDGRFAYLVEEMSGTVVVYRYTNGKLTRVQEIAAHPGNYKGAIGSADIHVSPDGRYLYASNRGDENNLAVFSINTATGKLTAKSYQPVLGKTPRNFTLDPTGNYLLVANQESGNVVIMKRNKKTGGLTPTGDELKIPKPVCLKMIKMN